MADVALSRLQFLRAGDRNISGIGSWIAGALGAPANGDVLVDSGALVAGNYYISVSGYTSKDIIVDLQHRDAANATTVKSQRRGPTTGDFDIVIGAKFPVGTDERLRVVLVSGAGGTIQASLSLEEVV